MLRLLSQITLCFQRFFCTPGNSAQHEAQHDLKWTDVMDTLPV
jgi:hypothetical protein